MFFRVNLFCQYFSSSSNKMDFCWYKSETDVLKHGLLTSNKYDINIRFVRVTQDIKKTPLLYRQKANFPLSVQHIMTNVVVTDHYVETKTYFWKNTYILDTHKVLFWLPLRGFKPLFARCCSVSLALSQSEKNIVLSARETLPLIWLAGFMVGGVTSRCVLFKRVWSLEATEHELPHAAKQEEKRGDFCSCTTNTFNTLRGEDKINAKTVWIVKPFVGYL